MVQFPQSFLSPVWDTVERETLERWLLKMFNEQLLHSTSTSSFWSKRIDSKLLTKTDFSRTDIESLPLLSKQEMRAIDSLDLLPDNDKSFYLMRGSGGTTGVPASLFWTKGDWLASIETAGRFLKRFPKWDGLRIWNAYSQGHVAGPAIDDFIRIAGASPIPRHFKATETQALAEMKRLKVDGLSITPKSGSGKGGSLEDFLSQDPSFISRLNITNLLLSSTVLDDDLLAELRELGVKHIVNFYGSTEGLPTAISCVANPQVFHLCQGHVFVEIVDDSGHHVRSGERGRVVVSRIGSSEGKSISPVGATQLIRFVVGDIVTYIDEPCSCGLSTARIAHIERLPFDDKKIQGGCEQWD